MLAGGYRLRDGSRLTIAVMGALVPEAMEAAEELGAEVVCITSADLLFRAFQARAGLGEGDPSILDELFPEPLPIVIAARRPPAHAELPGRRPRRADDAASACSASASRATSAELYEHHQIDAESVIGAALDLLECMTSPSPAGGSSASPPPARSPCAG